MYNAIQKKAPSLGGSFTPKGTHGSQEHLPPQQSSPYNIAGCGPSAQTNTSSTEKEGKKARGLSTWHKGTEGKAHLLV